MKLFFTFLLSTFLLSSVQAQRGPLEQVIAALKTGNAGALSQHFDENVEITLPDKSDNYSKAQAQQIIRDFFSMNQVKGFDLRHKGTSPGGHFCIGTLLTRNGNFRTNVFMRVRGGKEQLKEIRFQTID